MAHLSDIGFQINPQLRSFSSALSFRRLNSCIMPFSVSNSPTDLLIFTKKLLIKVDLKKKSQSAYCFIFAEYAKSASRKY